jgi:ABC-type sugar transport system substrate-binding protein
VDQIRNEKVKEKCVSLFSGNMSAKTHIDRNGAFLETLKKLRPDIKVYTYQALSNFEKARELAAKNLNQISRCYGVFAGSDSMTLGVLEAFDKSTVRRPPVLMGYDSVPEVQRKILAGKIKASVEQSPADMGRASMTSFHNYFDAKPVEKYQTILPRLTVQSHKLESIAPPAEAK